MYIMSLSSFVVQSTRDQPIRVLGGGTVWCARTRELYIIIKIRNKCYNHTDMFFLPENAEWAQMNGRTQRPENASANPR